MKPKKYTFFYHYNKPASKAAGKNKLTVHWRGKCIIVDKIHCKVHTYSCDRKTQPRCVIKGSANYINITTKLNGETWAELFDCSLLGDKNFSDKEFNLKP